MRNWEKIKAFFDRTPRPIKWMFTRVGRIMTLSVISGAIFMTSQLESISIRTNNILFYISVTLAVYPLLAGLWYIANGLIINPFIMYKDTADFMHAFIYSFNILLAFANYVSKFFSFFSITNNNDA